MARLYWLASYPKSGNTWLRAFLGNLTTDQAQPLSINRLQTGAIASNRQWLDDVLGFDTADLSADEIDELRPAVYRWGSVPGAQPYCKIHDACRNAAWVDPAYLAGTLYIVRNPLDLAPSCAHHWNCSLDEAIRKIGCDAAALFGNDHGIGAQVRQRLSSWSGHIASWLETPGAALQVIRYEDMQQSPLQTFTEAARFLGLPEDTARIQRAIDFSRFAELAAQEATDRFVEAPASGKRFFRRGESGGWRDTLSAEQVRRIVADHRQMMARFGYLDDALNWIAAQP